MDGCRTVNGSSLFRHLAKLITLGIELSRGKTWPIKSLSVLSMIENKVALLDQKWTRSESRYLIIGNYRYMVSFEKTGGASISKEEEGAPRRESSVIVGGR